MDLKENLQKLYEDNKSKLDRENEIELIKYKSIKPKKIFGEPTDAAVATVKASYETSLDPVISVAKQEGNNFGELILIKKGDTEIVEKLNFNLQNILTNKANPFPPTVAKEGELWYDSTKKSINVYDGIKWVKLLLASDESVSTTSTTDSTIKKTSLESQLSATISELEAQKLALQTTILNNTQLTQEEISKLQNQINAINDIKISQNSELVALQTQTIEQFQSALKSEISPGTTSYKDGILKFWALDVIDDTNNIKYGTVSAITSNRITLTSATLNEIVVDKSIIIFREKVGIEWKTKNRNYKVSAKGTNWIEIYSIDSSLQRSTSPLEVSIGFEVFQAGGWKTIISDFISTGQTKTTEFTTVGEHDTKIATQQTIVNNMTTAGWTDDQRDYVLAKAYLEVYKKDRDIFLAKLNYGENSTQYTAAIAARAVAFQATQLPPPTTKEIVTKIVDKISLSVMGSMEIAMNVGVQATTSSTVPTYISSFSGDGGYGYTPSVKGTNDNLGVNYTVIQGAYQGSTNTNGSISFVIDIVKAAGLDETQRGNYRYDAFSALFKMKEINFWDYTANNATWQYLVNMTPVTTNPDNVNYGKFTIYCQVFAAKYYHAAIIGARWFSILNKFRNF